MADRSGTLVRWGARAAVLVALLGLLGWPVARLAVEGVSEGLGRVVDAVGSVGASAVLNSVWVAAAVTGASLVVALGLALLTERTGVRGRGVLRVAIVAQLLVPDFVAAIAWTRAYGPAGLSERIAGLGLPGLYGPLGIVVVMAVGAVPLAYLVIVAGMRVRAEPDSERAARASGAGAVTTLRTVTLPLLAPSIAAAGALVFITSMNAFGTPAVLGRPAGFGTMTTQIYQDLAFSASDAAFLRVIGLAALLAVIAIAVAAIGVRAVPEAAPRTTASAGAPPRGRGRAGALIGVIGAWAYLVLAVVVPIVALVLTALTRAVGLPPTPGNLTLDNVGRALDPHAATALANSLLLSAATAFGAVVLGTLAVAAWRGRWRKRVGALITIGFAVPGSVVAVAVLLAYSGLLRDTLAIIFIAYLAKLWSLGQRPIAGAWDRVPADLTRAARIHGAGGATAARTVLLPMLTPALAAAGLLVFLFALHEIAISVLLYGPTTSTLAVAVLNLQELGDPTATSALAVVLTALVGAVGAVVVLVARRQPWLTALVR